MSTLTVTSPRGVCCSKVTVPETVESIPVEPRMRATGLVDGALHFEADSVSDLKDPDEHYMGSMILRFVSDDVVEQHWISIEAGETSEMGVFTLRRAE